MLRLFLARLELFFSEEQPVAELCRPLEGHAHHVGARPDTLEIGIAPWRLRWRVWGASRRGRLRRQGDSNRETQRREQPTKHRDPTHATPNSNQQSPITNHQPITNPQSLNQQCRYGCSGTL